ncbi:helix-turn-helix transcriptional regulator [Nocardia africana]
MSSASPHCLPDGSTTRGIAKTLYLTMSTVKWHRRNIYRKLDIDSREALRMVLETDDDNRTESPT